MVKKEEKYSLQNSQVMSCSCRSQFRLTDLTYFTTRRQSLIWQVLPLSARKPYLRLIQKSNTKLQVKKIIWAYFGLTHERATCDFHGTKNKLELGLYIHIPFKRDPPEHLKLEITEGPSRDKFVQK